MLHLNIKPITAKLEMSKLNDWRSVRNEQGLSFFGGNYQPAFTNCIIDKPEIGSCLMS